MLGLDSAGKTTILYKLQIGEVIPTCPTIGFNIETVRFKGLNLTVWDVSGDLRTRKFWKSYYEKVNGIIFVVDSDDRKSMNTIKEELNDLLNTNELSRIPLLILANKQDLPQAMTVSEVLQGLDLYKIRDRQWHLHAVCALSGEGLTQAMSRFIQMISNI
jgi:small GTP-binding protein